MLPKIDMGAGVATEIQQIYMFLILQWHVLPLSCNAERTDWILSISFFDSLAFKQFAVP